MKAAERIEKQKLLIEELGRVFDKEGYQPITGRILALLMVMDKELYTFDEIVEELQISKSSASTALKNLEVVGKVEYLTLPGDRKRYFRAKAPDVEALLQGFRAKFEGMHKVLSEAILLKADPNSRNAGIIKEMLGMFDFFNEHMEQMLEQYRKR